MKILLITTFIVSSIFSTKIIADSDFDSCIVSDNIIALDFSLQDTYVDLSAKTKSNLATIRNSIIPSRSKDCDELEIKTLSFLNGLNEDQNKERYINSYAETYNFDSCIVDNRVIKIDFSLQHIYANFSEDTDKKFKQIRNELIPTSSRGCEDFENKTLSFLNELEKVVSKEDFVSGYYLTAQDLEDIYLR